MKMDTEDYVDLLSARAADARAMMMFFAVFHTGLLVVLGFAGAGLEDSGIQLALAAVAVLTSLWTFFFMDDCMQDLFACLLYTSPSPRDRTRSRMPSSA